MDLGRYLAGWPGSMSEQEPRRPSSSGGSITDHQSSVMPISVPGNTPESPASPSTGSRNRIGQRRLPPRLSPGVGRWHYGLGRRWLSPPGQPSSPALLLGTLSGASFWFGCLGRTVATLAVVRSCSSASRVNSKLHVPARIGHRHHEFGHCIFFDIVGIMPVLVIRSGLQVLPHVPDFRRTYRAWYSLRWPIHPRRRLCLAAGFHLPFPVGGAMMPLSGSSNKAESPSPDLWTAAV